MGSVKSIELPLKTFMNGRWWYLYTYDYRTPDGTFCGYFHATSDEHAAVLLLDMREHAELKGRMVP